MNISEHLRALGLEEIQPALPEFGICDEVENLFKEVIPVEFFKSWIGYSCNPMFPVKAPKELEGDGSTNPEVRASSAPDLWIGEYGDSRRALCLHLANEYERIGK